MVIWSLFARACAMLLVCLAKFCAFHSREAVVFFIDAKRRASNFTQMLTKELFYDLEMDKARMY